MQFAVKIAVSLALVLCASAVSSDNGGAVFSVLSDSERQRVEPVLSESYFKNGFPRRYLRHRLVRIDTEQLQYLLDSDWRANDEGKTTQGVVLGLFNDLNVRVTVDLMIRNESHGATSYIGRQKSDQPGVTSFDSFFHDSGLFKAVVRTEDASYLIENALDNTYFVILAQSPMDHAFD